MNWTASIKKLLGVFWTRLFSGSSLIDAIINLHTVYGKCLEAAHTNWVYSQAVADISVAQGGLPFCLLLDIDSLRHPVASFEDILNGGTIGAADVAAGWLMDCAETGFPYPYLLTDHVILHNRTLFAGLDYEYANQQFLFRMDPTLLGLPMLKRTDTDGVLRLYYIVYGWGRNRVQQKDAVAGFLGRGLDCTAANAWEVHQTGATYYNAKRLLAKATSSVICEADGIVHDIWQEQGYTCVQVGDNVYSALMNLPVNVEKGFTTLTGAVLLGDLRFFSGKDTPTYEELPGLPVRTDVGTLVADNVEASAAVVSGVNVLQLTGAVADVAAYRALCAARTIDTRCPVIEVPSTVNPFMFITKVLRRGKSCVATITANTLQDVRGVLSVLRKGVCASGMFSVLIKAHGDVATPLEMHFTASAGQAAVAEAVTITIEAASASSKVVL